MRLIKTPEGEYVFFCTFSEKSHAFGFAWDKQFRCWRTKNPAIAIKCAAWADDELRDELEAAAKDLPDPTKAILTLKDGVFRYYSPYQWNHFAKDAGFRAAKEPYWHWWTEEIDKAAKCYRASALAIPEDFVCALDLQESLQRYLRSQSDAVAASRAKDADIDLPVPPGCALLPYQCAGVAYAKDKTRVLFGDEMRLGKAQPLDAMILTPRGFEPMEWMRIGTSIIGANGRTYYVTGVFPQGEKAIYRVTFSDGSSTECCEEHLWLVNSPLRRNRKAAARTLNTKTVALTLSHANGNRQHFIPLVAPVHYKPNDTPLLLDPYLLGALLGDGGLSTGRIVFSSSEEEMAGRVSELLPQGWHLRYKSGCDYKIAGFVPGQPNPVIDALRAMRLLGTKSNNKFIPPKYQFATVEERIALLQGLLDTDGYASKDNVVQFTSVSRRLINDTRRVVESLGGVARLTEKKTTGQLAYTLTLALPPEIQPFRLTRKAARYKPRPKFPPSRAIASVEYVGRKAAQCISTDAPDSLYVTDNFIVTHNTPQSIVWMNCDPSIRKVLIIVPATIKLNWKRELERWLMLDLRIGVAWGFDSWPGTDVVIINAEILYRQKDCYVEPVLLKSGKPKMKVVKGRQVPVTRKVYPLRKEIKDVAWDVVIVDEGHRFKDDKTARYQCLESLQPRRRAVLTGTPIPNRPVEIWPILHWLDPKTFPDKWKFAMRYAGAKKGPFGWDLTGASNLGELQDLLRRTLMVRRLRSQVLTELPPKRRQLIEFPCPDDRFVNEQETLWRRYTDISSFVREAVEDSTITPHVEEHRELVMSLETDRMACFEEMSRVRHEDAIKRIPFVVAHLKELLEDEPKAICFAWHNDVVEQIAKEFDASESIVIYGKTPQNQRVALQDRFNQDEKCKLCVISIAVCEGLDLSSASLGVMAEHDWVPKNIAQAEDRMENPFKKDSSLIQYLVFQGSLDAKMAQTLVYKEEVGYDALDRETAQLAKLVNVATPETIPVVLPEKREAFGPESPSEALPEFSSVARTTSESLKTSPSLSVRDCATIHAAVRKVAGMCDGAFVKDSQGFNAMDVRTGHWLASLDSLNPKTANIALSVLKKYRHTQLNGELEKFYE